jgi:hypothetical protein
MNVEHHDNERASMPQRSDDPYSDFMVRVMNSCRIAIAQQGAMNDTEYGIVRAVRDLLLELDPAIDPDANRANIIIREMP